MRRLVSRAAPPTTAFAVANVQRHRHPSPSAIRSSACAYARTLRKGKARASDAIRVSLVRFAGRKNQVRHKEKYPIYSCRSKGKYLEQKDRQNDVNAANVEVDGPGARRRAEEFRVELTLKTSLSHLLWLPRSFSLLHVICYMHRARVYSSSTSSRRIIININRSRHNEINYHEDG